MEMLVNCDIIVASSDAKFSFPEVKRGVVAALGGGFKQRAWSSDLLLIIALRYTSHSAYMRSPGGFSVQYGQTPAFQSFS
jgi:enoyl-CoA hydratase/carnithine racemase